MDTEGRGQGPEPLGRLTQRFPPPVPAPGEPAVRFVLAGILLGLLLLPAVATAGSVISPPLDTGGPIVLLFGASPNPVEANATVVVTAVLTDPEGSAVAGVFLEIGLMVAMRMNPDDGAYDGPTESVSLIAPAFLPVGRYVLTAYGLDAVGNWGSPAYLFLDVIEHVPISPNVDSLAAAPSVAVIGEPVIASVSFWTPTAGDSLEAEYFMDQLGLDGFGTPLAWVGVAGNVQDMEATVATAPLAPGDHLLYAHGRANGGPWGGYAVLPFTIVAPELALAIVTGSASASPGDVVPVTVRLENQGTSPASSVQVDLYLAGQLALVGDNAASLGGARWGQYSYALAVPPSAPLLLDLQLAVLPEAPDGSRAGVSISVHYSSLAGVSYGPVHASASVEIRAVEFAVSLAPLMVLEAHPGDHLETALELRVPGVLAVGDVVLELRPGPWMTAEAVDAASIGGVSRSDGTLLFPRLEPGTHTLPLRISVEASAPDRTATTLRYAARFVSRQGQPVEYTGSFEIPIRRPVLSVDIVLDRPTLGIGETATATVTVRNRGSVLGHASLRLDGGGRLLVKEASRPLRQDASVATIDLGDVGPGEVSFQVTVVSRAGDGRLGVLTATVAYATPSGFSLGTVMDEAEAILVPPVAVDPAAAPAKGLGALALVPVASTALVSLGLLGLFGTERGQTALLFLAVPLYTRLRREQVLEHETRGMIRGYVIANPGDHFNSIKDGLALNNGTLAYHLHVLEKEGIVRSVKDGKFRRFFPAEMKIPLNGELPTKVQRLVLEIVLETPAISQKEIAKLLGLSQSTISYHLDRLKELGLVRAEREGMQLCYYVLPMGIEILSTVA